jgi:putative MATE family efflux protein
MIFFQHINRKARTVLSLTQQALSTQYQDYTQGSIRRAVFLLAIPMILEMCMESIFAVVDIFFVGRLGQEAVATVGLTESVLSLVYSIALGMGMATTAMVARRVGEKRPDEAGRAAAQGILLALAGSLLISVSGVLFASRILGLMGGSTKLVSIGSGYTRLIFGSSVVIMLLFLINGIFRGAGNAYQAMWSLWIANALNIVLCPLLIHFYGLSGAAMATSIGRGAGVCYQLVLLFRGKPTVRLLRRYFRPVAGLIRTLLSIAWTGTMQYLIGSASWIVMARLVARFGSTAIAGYQVAIRVFLFFLLPAWGMSNAAATLVGQNLGAGRAKRAERSVWVTAGYNTIFMALVSVLFLLGAPAIARFLNPDERIVRIAVQAMRIFGVGYVFNGVGMVMSNAFNGAGDTRTTTVLNLICFWAIQIPLGYLLSLGLNLGLQGVFLAIVISQSLLSAVSMGVFRRGKWKTVKV